MKICHIVAVDKNNCIGRGNDLPWHIPTDLKFFKEKTKNHPVIMGRKTFESIGSRPLPKRLNIVLSRQSLELPEGVLLCKTIEEAVDLAKKTKDYNTSEIFIVGGAQIYKDSLELADRLYITRVGTNVSEGEAFYPEVPENFSLVDSRKDHDVYDLDFQTYER